MTNWILSTHYHISTPWSFNASVNNVQVQRRKASSVSLQILTCNIWDSIYLRLSFWCWRFPSINEKAFNPSVNICCWCKENRFPVFVCVTVPRPRTHQACVGDCVLAGLVLCSLDPGLQVSRRVEVLALVSAAAALDVVHADDDRVLAAVHHAGLQGVSVAAVALAPRAVTALKFPTNLAGSGGSTGHCLLFIILWPNIETQQPHTGHKPPACLCAHVFVQRCRCPWLPGRWDSPGPGGEHWAAAQASSPCRGPCGSDRDWTPYWDSLPGRASSRMWSEGEREREKSWDKRDSTTSYDRVYSKSRKSLRGFGGNMVRTMGFL